MIRNAGDFVPGVPVLITFVAWLLTNLSAFLIRAMAG